ncbi:MAG: aspartate aminotransferase family protein [Candidatus Omnitrophota bacterium]|nr:aspartate aminotransferase family protein [Candidatus Omnitrophota bacterium]
MTEKEVLQAYQKYVVPSYRRTNLCLVKGEGAWVTDIQGKRYLDFFPGWAVSGIGHCHPRVVKAVTEQAKKAIHFSNNFLHPLQAQLAKELVRSSFPGKCFFANSGAEANEAAIKLARLAGHPDGRYQIISFTGSFHGRTLATLTMTGQRKVQKGFSPLPSGFRKAKFNDLESVKKVLGPRTAAICIEPIQGEGGVNPARPGFLKNLRQLCNQNGILLIFDEVQTGMGRTGKLFAFQRYQVTPDAMTLAKTLGGGVPIGAIIIAEKYADILSPGAHASTFGGGPLVCAAALAALEAIKKEKLLENAVRMGAYLQERLRKISPLVKEVRGIGLMLGVELKIPAAKITEEAQKNGLLVNCTQHNVLRVMPPLTLTRDEADLGLSILKQCLS